MAATDSDAGDFSLVGLEDELTCCICLSPFECPVTIPCGHNFCHDCLITTWKDSYTCPQCRTHFATKPELKKNTVLSNVVESFKMKSSKSELGLHADGVKESVVCCDTCMQVEASRTCLTCMASFCEEHLKPHRENPNYRLHQLSEPLADLSERICPDHHKLMELFCVQHGRVICSFCLQQVHKGCSFTTPEEQRGLKQSDLRNKLGLLDGKIEKNKMVISQMRDKEDMLKDSATNRKRALMAEYQQMRDMLDRDEREALSVVDREQESGQTKLKGLVKKFTENIEKMSKAKEYINSLLGQDQTLAFLQVSVNLPSAVDFSPYSPQFTLDSKTVTATQAFAAILKEHLAQILTQPVEARLRILKQELNTGIFPTGGLLVGPSGTVPLSGFSVFSPERTFPQPGFEMPLPPGQQRQIRSHSPGAALRAGQKKRPQKKKSENIDQTHPKPDQQTRKPPQAPRESAVNMRGACSMENLLDLMKKDQCRGRSPAKEPKGKPGKRRPPETTDIPPNITSAAKRNDLLKYGTVLTLNPKTAHKRIILSEDFTVASVSDEPRNYPDCPARFSVCSQVLTSKGFSRGRHYWEVKLSSNNFIGIGLAYNSVDRKGPASRLGRNAQSWCVEWFNVKLSAWHASSETVLTNANPKRVGVLLDCEGGTATFYNVADRAYPFHSFVFPFAETVYPAFWIFSNGSSISLCKLQA